MWLYWVPSRRALGEGGLEGLREFWFGGGGDKSFF